MTVFGKPLIQYLSFVRWFCLLIIIVGLTRLSLSLRGVPNSNTKWLSMSAVLAFGIIYYAIRVHTTGFGSYKQLLPVVAIPNAVTHLVSITGIIFGIVTGQENVFTAPEYSFGVGGTWGHVAAHLLVGMTIGALVNWLIGCLVLFITKKIVRRSE
jgi:hypothetical protein